MTQRVKHLDVSAVGTSLRFVFDDSVQPEFIEQLQQSWIGAEIHSDHPDRQIEVSQSQDADQQFESLTVIATLNALQHRRGEFMMFHAAGLADERGRVAAFVGPSGRGKTTLSRALGQHYGYVSDETVGVDHDLTVYPYRKPLSMVREGKPKQQVSPAEAGLLDLPDASLALSSLILMERDEEVAMPIVEEVSFLDAVTELVPQMSYLPEVPRPLQRLAALCDAVGGVVRVRYANAPDVVQLMPELVERTPIEAAWEVCLESVDGPYGVSGVDDAIRIDDCVVVLGDGQVQVLDGIAPAIWDAARSGKDRHGIAEHVVDIYGEPEGVDSSALVDAALTDLVNAGVLKSN